MSKVGYFSLVVEKQYCLDNSIQITKNHFGYLNHVRLFFPPCLLILSWWMISLSIVFKLTFTTYNELHKYLLVNKLILLIINLETYFSLGSIIM